MDPFHDTTTSYKFHQPPEGSETFLTPFPSLPFPSIYSLSFAAAYLSRFSLSRHIRHMDPNPDFTQTQSLSRTLGPRPNPSSVTTARAKITEIESKLSRNDDGVGRFEMEKEMEELVRVYGSVVSQLEKKDEEERSEEGLDDEVVAILKRAATEEVKKIELLGRRLRFLPESFGKLHGLIVLNLSRNELEAIPDSIAGLQKLEELNVSSNFLESLPDSIGLLVNLKILNVSGNKLHALPSSIALCSSLEELDASFNDLTYLPANIGFGLINLKRLSIYLNKIRNLPNSICEMRSLRYLDAHFNELLGLPHAIGRLTNLEVLNISSNFNDLTELPESIGDLTNLKELDLSNNQIHALPITFGKLQNLTKLNLDQNPLEIPPLDVVSKGVEAVKEFMGKMWLDFISEDERRSNDEANKSALTSWLVSLAGYFGEGNTSRDPYLDQQL